jgi:hypothetical protein
MEKKGPTGHWQWSWYLILWIEISALYNLL